jgi:hypothetical protein
VPGFRYVLELANREPADPMMFNTALPPAMWKPGDTFLAAYDLRQFRILEIGELGTGGLGADSLASTTAPWRDRRRTRGRPG